MREFSCEKNIFYQMRLCKTNNSCVYGGRLDGKPSFCKKLSKTWNLFGHRQRCVCCRTVSTKTHRIFARSRHTRPVFSLLQPEKSTKHPQQSTNSKKLFLQRDAIKIRFWLRLVEALCSILSGFVAATYLRGIPYVSVPTSLLAMVDASLGGKVAINTPFGKNTLGAIYPPRAVFMDFAFLTTLPHSERLQGFAEMIKYGLIAEKTLFFSLSEWKDWCLEWDLSFVKKLILKSCLIKKRIVEVDPLDRGKRRILNFGHTFGHAIELIEKYEISHGEAVAMGLIGESMLSMRLGLLQEKEYDQIATLIRGLGFSLTLSSKKTVEEMVEACQQDKKRRPRQGAFSFFFRP